MTMNRNRVVIVVASLLYLLTGTAYAQVAGKVKVGVTITQMEEVVLGWSAKQDLLAQSVYNDQKQKIGEISDLIITPKNAVAYVIIGVGGFLGIDRKDIAIPMAQIQYRDKNLALPGATKDALKTLPKFEYAKKK
jgi:hypothetical protein